MSVDSYQRVCHINDIPKEGSKELTLKGTSFIAVKSDNDIYLYHNRCPHLGLPLQCQQDQFLNYDKSLILCSLHGALFEINSGRCILGPCQNQALKAADYYIKDEHIYIKDLR